MPEPRKISERLAEERRCRIAELHDKGLSPATIARQLEVPQAVVVADLKQINKAVLEKFQGMTGAELIVQSNAFLEKVKEFAIREMQSTTKKVEKRVKADGTVEEVEVVDPNKPKFLLGALKAEEIRMSNLFKAGLIPRNNPDKLFEGLADIRKASEAKPTGEIESRSREDVLDSIDKLLKHAPRL